MTAVDQKEYARILGTKLPGTIASEAEYKSMLSEARSLFEREVLSVAEERFLDLITLLIERYEDERFPTAKVDPIAIIKELMSAQSVSQSEFARVIGSKGNASEILSAKRGVSKSQAKRLGAFFNVPAHLFLGL